MDRRDLLELLSTAALFAGIAPERAGAAPPPRALPQGAPSALDAARRALSGRIAELIMPRTDTPGAAEAGVIDFIDVIVTSWYHDDERAGFLAGLAEVDRRAQALAQRPFLQLTEGQQAAVLSGLEAESRALPSGSPTTFWDRIKGLTVYGYYTSEVGVREELREVFMSGRYDGDAPLVRAAATPGGH